MEVKFHHNDKTMKLARKLALFTDPMRLQAFFFLFNSKKQDLCVTDVAAYLKSSLSNTSHQLRKLELAGVVEPHRNGRMICYRVKRTDENKVLYKCLQNLLNN